MSRRQLTLGDLRKFTFSWPDSTPLVAADSVVNPDEPVETQEFILDEGNVPVVALDDGGAQRALRIGREHNMAATICTRCGKVGTACRCPKARCADCGEYGELTGHQECQYPQDHN